MRGSNLNKATLDCNNQIKKTMIATAVLFNVLVIILYLYKKCYNYTKFFLTSIPEMVVFFLVFRISRPLIKIENNIKTLVDSGTPLTRKGIPSMLFDILFISMVTKVFLVYSNMWALLYSLILVSIFYEFFYKTYRNFNKLK